MVQLFLLIWLLLLAGTPIILILAASVGYKHDVTPIRSVFAFSIAFLAHLVASYFSFFLAFAFLYAGAHSVPGDEGIRWEAPVIILAALIGYLMLAFSVASIIAGRARPWPLRLPSLK